MTDNSLLEDFADETREHLEELESSLLRLESDPGNRELLNTIFRSMHTIKGASEYLGFERIAQLSHRLENLLDLFREGSLTADKVAVDLLIDARDRIGNLIAQVEKSGQETAEIDDLLDRVTALSEGPSVADGATVYQGEADTELFDIFMEQLASGITELMDTTRQMARLEDVLSVAARMTEQVDRLSATANYMGYDALTAVYDEMLAGLAAFVAQPESVDAGTVETFLQATVVSGVKRIQELFPNAEPLSAIDTDLSMSAVDEAPASVEAEETVADALPQDDNDAEDRFSLNLDDEADDVDETTALAAETDNSLLADFADETREHLEALESSLLRLESDPGNRELLNTIFRSMHTIKGASEYLGFERIAQLSHRLENLLDLFREGSLTADKVAVDLLIDARDRIGNLIAQVEKSGQETAEIDDLLDRVTALSEGPSVADGATVYQGEADTELFDIFMEQLASGITELMDTTRQMARLEDVLSVAARMTEQVDRLSATANYMGYDALTAVYDEMLAGLAAFVAQPESVDAGTVETFLQATVVSGVKRIQELFPNAEPLSAIDTDLSMSAVDEAPASVEAEETVADALPQDDNDADFGMPIGDEDPEAVETQAGGTATEDVPGPAEDVNNYGNTDPLP